MTEGSTVEPLTATFVAHGGKAQEPRTGSLEAALERAVASGRAAWKAVPLDPALFVAHLGRHLADEPDPEAALGTLVLGDLWLACACAAGAPAALAALEADAFPRALAYVAKVQRGVAGLDDVAQTLRVRLLLREPGREPAIATYAGRAPLVTWLRVAAVREARQALRRSARVPERSVTPERLGEVGRPTGRAATPEGALLQQEGASGVGSAVERVLRALDERDRVVLRLYFVEGMTLATLGRIYHVHESTMARRLQALRAKLLDEVKRELAVGSTSLASLVALAESQLDVHLSAVLARS